MLAEPAMNEVTPLNESPLSSSEIEEQTCGKLLKTDKLSALRVSYLKILTKHAYTAMEKIVHLLQVIGRYVRYGADSMS